MINKEVVVFQIEDMLSNINKENLLSFGGHIDNGAAFLELMTNVLTLLKEQEAKNVIAEKRKILFDDSCDEARYYEDTFYHCPSCNRILSRTHMKKSIHFCEECGQEVKWE